MSSRPSGWYDDPHDDELLRYFDGVVWTEHTALRRPRPAAPVSPSAGGPTTGGATPPPGGGASWGDRSGDRRPDGVSTGRTGAGAPRAPWAAAGPRDVAADGTPRSGWWRRVGAVVLDNIVVSLLSLPFVLGRTDSLVNGYLDLSRRAARGEVPQVDGEFASTLLVVSLTTLVVGLVYEVAMLAWRGATLGRMATGIRVRPTGADGPVPWPAGLARSCVKFAGSVFGYLPVLGLFAQIFQCVDWLWPLGDARRQALHDKVARTEVVRGRPVRRGERRGAHRGPRR